MVEVILGQGPFVKFAHALDPFSNREYGNESEVVERHVDAGRVAAVVIDDDQIGRFHCLTARRPALPV